MPLIGGESALCQLFNWCAKKNTKTPLKEKIFITIETEKCDTPKRIMDLPGVRANDGSNPEDAGVNKAIVEMVTDELKKPNSMVICLAEARSDPLNDNMLRELQKSQAIDDRGDLHKRLLLVLTKSDQWFGDVGCAEDVRKQLRTWQREFFRCEPMLLGWKSMVNECCGPRQQGPSMLQDAARDRFATVLGVPGESDLRPTMSLDSLGFAFPSLCPHALWV